MRKKLGIRVLAVIMALMMSGAMVGSALAVNISPKASNYLSSYSANAYTGSGCDVEIVYDVDATRVMDLVGVSYLVIQEYNNGTWTGVASTFGTTGNGLLAANTSSHEGSIIYPGGTSGKQYRALVIVYAELDGGYDSRTITTSSVTAG